MWARWLNLVGRGRLVQTCGRGRRGSAEGLTAAANVARWAWRRPGTDAERSGVAAEQPASPPPILDASIRSCRGGCDSRAAQQLPVADTGAQCDGAVEHQLPVGRSGWCDDSRSTTAGAEVYGGGEVHRDVQNALFRFAGDVWPKLVRSWRALKRRPRPGRPPRLPSPPHPRREPPASDRSRRTGCGSRWCRWRTRSAVRPRRPRRSRATS